MSKKSIASKIGYEYLGKGFDNAGDEGFIVRKIGTAELINIGTNIDQAVEWLYDKFERFLQSQYYDWRKAGEEAAEGTDIPFTYDCGEGSAREDFTNWANLDQEITFEEMFELEKWFENL